MYKIGKVGPNRKSVKIGTSDKLKKIGLIEQNWKVGKKFYLFQLIAKIMAKIPLAINMTFCITSSFTFCNSFQFKILKPKCLVKIFLHFFRPLSNLPLKSRSNLKSNFSLIFDLNRTKIRVKIKIKVTKMAAKPMAKYVDWFWSFWNGWIWK